jgi:glycosyltransferase involved in cell wall biosynthesis
MRVLHMVQNLNYGGMERVIADLLRRLDPGQFEPHLMVLQYLGRFAEGLGEFAALHEGPRLSRWSMVFPGRLAERIRAIAPDVVHTHSGVWYKGALAGRAAGVRRVVHTEHGRKSPDPWSDRWIDRRASRRTDAVVAVSPALGGHLTTRVVVPSCRVVVIPNGIDVERFCVRPRDGAVRAELGLDPETPVIGSIGRLEPIKGYDVMVRALARVRSHWRGPRPPVLVVAGDGSERRALDALVRELGLQGAAFLLGWRDDPTALLASFTLFTMSSHSEGTSVSLLEAMSSGLCPVVTDVGGNRAVLGEALAHRLVPPRDPAALAEAWLDTLRDDGRRRVDGAGARERVVGHYGVETMVAAYQRLYEELA